MSANNPFPKSDKQFYVGQKAIIEKDGKILILHDPNFDSDLPGGKIQEGEYDFPEALKREVREETALEIEVGEPFYVGYWKNPFIDDHRNAGKEIVIVFYRAKYVSGEVVLSDEHDWYKWIDQSEWKQMQQADTPRTAVIEAVEKYFGLSPQST